MPAVSPLAPGHSQCNSIERRGLWGTPTNVNPPAQRNIDPQITGAHQAASDHAAIFVDINI
jgi:hypothetical protein